MTDMQLARYSETGELRVLATEEAPAADLGYFDADGGEWEEPVEALLRAQGYEPSGPWTIDEDGDAWRPVTTSQFDR